MMPRPTTPTVPPTVPCIAINVIPMLRESSTLVAGLLQRLPHGGLFPHARFAYRRRAFCQTPKREDTHASEIGLAGAGRRGGGHRDRRRARPGARPGQED